MSILNKLPLTTFKLPSGETIESRNILKTIVFSKQTKQNPNILKKNIFCKYCKNRKC